MTRFSRSLGNKACSLRPSSPNGEGGIRITSESSHETQILEKAGTESGTVLPETVSQDESAVASAWNQLPEETRQRLAALTPEVLAALEALFSGRPRRS
jgi:hypothetical protein